MKESLAGRLAALFGERPEVVAVALGGSAASGAADGASDIDLYVYLRDALSLSAREAIVARTGGASRADMDLNYWGGGDVWFDAVTGIEVDAIYFGATWMVEQVRRVLVEHTPSLGYTTAFWHTVRVSHPLYDPEGWFAALQVEAAAPYPEPLRQAIVSHNHPILRDIIPSWRNQIASAVGRGDLASINHRLAMLLACYFDIVFAVNRVPHPGGKRLLAQVEARCPSLPAAVSDDVTAALTAAGAAPGDLLGHLDRLLDRLDEWLTAAGFSLL